MATISNKARVGDAFDLLAQGLEPFVSHHMTKATKRSDWAEHFVATSKNPTRVYDTSDPSFLLNVMIDAWDSTFRRQLPRSVRNLIFTLRDKRNDWAHNRAMQAHDATFILSGIITLLEAVDATETDTVQVSLDDLNRSLYEKEKEKITDEGIQPNVLDAPTAGLTPWRDVIRPHRDVASGAFTVAEFAADLELVRRGKGSAEYTDPKLFFERTYLTRGLRELLTMGVKRITATGGQPVVNCQTNFGGGKTHSLIALYHLFSGVDPATLPVDVQQLLADAGVDQLPAVRRAVVVGNRFAAGQSHERPDGITVNTIWGEIAWQLAGTDGYAKVAQADQSRTNPGDAIREVLAMAAPCLVLIDEWVAYARELYDRDDLPGGTFHSQFGFAQALSEAARGTDGVMLVVSIPASATAPDSDEVEYSSLEVGGYAGRRALEELTHVVTRQAEQWKPASGDESFEIVRRRLFEPLDADKVLARDGTAEAFGELYRSNRGDFPSECVDLGYVDRIKSAYPIHPEVFDRLYEDWSTVDRFQRTRGVLRLMAAVINSLWESDDRSPLILPCSIPLLDARVNGELAGKLPDHWNPVIDADVDGPASRSWEIDREVPALGQHRATRRVARTIFFGATPNVGSVNQGLETSRIRLGSVFAGERTGFVGDALARLANSATYIGQDRDRYWFDRQENVNRTATDEATRLLAVDGKHEVHAEIIRRLQGDKNRGEFARVHIAPSTSGDVDDTDMVGLVVLGPGQAHIANAPNSSALEAARDILANRASGKREHSNMLIFAAADERSLEGLEQAAADHLAWSMILAEWEERGLTARQRKQAEDQVSRTDGAVDLRLAEAYKHAIIPRKDDPLGETTFDVSPLDQQGSVAQRVSRRLVGDGNLHVQFPPVMLRHKLDTVLARRWADTGYVDVETLWKDFAKYLYLPRLRDQQVLVETIKQGAGTLTWQSDGFAVAAAVDPDTGRFLGLTTGAIPEQVSPRTLLVRPDFALGQIEAEEDQEEGEGGRDPEDLREGDDRQSQDQPGDDRPPPATIFRGSVVLNDRRPVKHFGDVHQELVDHLMANGEVEVRIEISARNPDGYPEHVVRTVTENARTLKFDDGAGFSEH